MITGNEIQSLVNLFEKRHLSLYHACQLIDFESYLALGGIPSRALLESKQAKFTTFDTDGTDLENRVWDKVFVNLSDFGRGFAQGAKSVPNPYGPILFEIKPKALLEASDVAVCLWSAGAKGFNRESEALNTLEDINRLFVHPSNSGTPYSTYIKFRNKLEQDFGKQKAQDPEISCTVPNGVFSTQYVSLVRVDPYIVNYQSLRDRIEAIKQKCQVPFPIYERGYFKESRRNFYNEIAERIGEEIPTLHALASDDTCSQPLRVWAGQIPQLEWQFQRYATYLHNGTLKPMKTSTILDEHEAKRSTLLN
jgi:hypothetical protein